MICPVFPVSKVMGVSHTLYEHELETMKAARGVDLDTDLTTADLKELVEKYKGVYQKALGEDFPTGNLLKF
jgi:pyruvate,orthophosphate dikinase